MTRPLTQFELDILAAKCKNWSYGKSVLNGLIPLGNGEGDEITAYFPHDLLFNSQIGQLIEPYHTIPA